MIKFTGAQIEHTIQSIGSQWSSVEDKHIQKTYHFDTFVEALAFVNAVGEIAEAVQHHPDLYIHYNKVVVELSTHDAGGLTQKDFDVAMKIDNM